MLDVEIVRELQRTMPELDIRFVSYAEGAREIAAAGFPIIDLGLPAQNSYVETSVLAGRLIGWLQPEAVIAHEEFAVMPAAKIFDKPTLFLTDWFTSPEKLTMAALRLADRILFLEEPEVFEEPETLRGRVSYFGPYQREFLFSRDDKAKARQECGLPGDAKLVGVFPGSWQEASTPLAELLEVCLPLLESINVHVVWMAGDDSQSLSERFSGQARFIIRQNERQIDAWMVACDAAITKCNRKSAMELLRLGIPSLAISWGFNPIDDFWVKRHDVIDWVSAANLTPDELARRVDWMLTYRELPEPWNPGVEGSSPNRELSTALSDWIRSAHLRVAAGA